MIKLHKIILTLTVLVVIVSNILVEAQVAPPPVHSEPLSPPPSSTSAPASPSPLPPQSCNTSIDCDNTKFCDQGNCQPRSSFGEKCVNKDGCLNPLTCNKGICQYKDNESTKNHNYDIRKAAITGGIIVGIFVVGGFIFIVYRCIKKRKERKGRELTSSVYSTDGTADFDPIYPFSERTNSFSSSKPTQPSHVPTTNHYDPLPPTGTTGNGGFVGGPGSRQGYYNYYNNEYKGGYMRQNENEVTKRTMNLLQQTRGNVMIAPHAPHAPPHIPHPQHPQLPQIPQLPQHTQNLRDLLDSNSVDSMLSSGSENNYVESIYDTYARDFRPKTLEVKLSKETNNNNVIKDNLARNTSEKKYDSTIEQNTSKDSKSVTRRSRSRTFGHVDPRIKSTTVQEQKSGSKGLNGINEYDEN
ncbi:18938_t:CDS:2 [Rhizophagus irregularis]|nr:18938_t:CDS:2 [Rhizophagus irregularis]